MAILNNSNAISAGGYDINNSLRFRSSASAYLNRTLTTPTDNKKWTYSTWIKRGSLTTTQVLLATSSEELRYIADGGASGVVDSFQYNYGAGYGFRTNATYRDVSAWYHIVVAVDTTQATAANRARIYINGVEASTDGTYNISQNTNTQINSAVAHNIARRTSGSLYFDGYQAETYFVDGQQLTPSSFGETDTTTGVWKPKVYTGTYGTNGFYLKFSDIATTSGSNAGLGKDFSGNSNYWTTNNISVTSGTTYDAMTDSPTLTSATVANYAVINSLAGSTLPSITEANLKVTGSSGGNFESSYSTIGMTTGKWYAEFTWLSSGNNCSQIGVGSYVYPRDSSNQNGFINGITQVNLDNSTATSRGIAENGTLLTGGDASFSFSVNDIIGIAFDADAKTVNFYKNNSILGSTYPYDVASVGDGIFYFITFTRTNTGTSSFAANFGQRPFAYTPPTGYNRLNTYNLPTPTILQGNKYMDATLYTGNGTSQSIVNAGGFKPDFIWIKTRSTTYNNNLQDSVRGAGKILLSNGTNAEFGNSGDLLTSFNSNGFTVNNTLTGGTDPTTDGSGQTFVGWQWQAGQGTTSSNTSGNITSTTSVSTTAGFSVVTYTGNGTSTQTVGHGLGVAPAMVIIKARSAAVQGGWFVYHKSLTSGYNLRLELTDAQFALSGTSNGGIGSSPSSTTFTLANGSSTNSNVNQSSQTYVAYCWAEIAGFSKFGSYTGNANASGPFIYTGFQPKFIMFKRTDAIENWGIWTPLAGGNGIASSNNFYLLPNTSGAQDTTQIIDILSNGFKIRDSGTFDNANGGTYVYAAFAESPFKNSLAR